MAKVKQLPPSARALSGSMRDIGYSAETAIADLVDNSISAGAKAIQIFLHHTRDMPFLCIQDDGGGMDEELLIAAMRHGSQGPERVRPKNDLGRFGLGLKTASFSQARVLTVVTRKGGATCGARWDLNLVDKMDEWVIELLDKHEIESLDHVADLGANGTIVYWHQVDRLSEGMAGEALQTLLEEKLSLIRDHLSLVFHRFLTGTASCFRRISISVNGLPITPFDPFCTANPATQHLPEQKLIVEGSAVVIQPYILPHHSRLSPDEYRFYKTRSDFLANQGAYVYRNGRLMAWGDWFRLTSKSEASKLARVKIDFSSDIDEAWTIDIKKSRAHPPMAVREQVRQIIDRVTDRSHRVSRGRGERLLGQDRSPVWIRHQDRGCIRYMVDPEHDLISAVRANLDGEASQNGFEMMLTAISASIPLEAIYSDFCSTPQQVMRPEIQRSELEIKLDQLAAMLGNLEDMDIERMIQVVLATGLFDNNQEAVREHLIRRQRKDISNDDCG